MATRKFKIEGWNHDAGTTATVTMGGTQVFSGAISTAVVNPYDGTNSPSGSDTDTHFILSFDYNNSDDTAEQEVACSIAITAGSATIGSVRVSSGSNSSGWPTDGTGPGLEQIDGDYYYQGGNNYPYGDGGASAIPEKKNILIDGATPPLTATTAEEGGIPSGGVSTPTFSGWQFCLENGQSISYTQRIPVNIAAYVAP